MTLKLGHAPSINVGTATDWTLGADCSVHSPTLPIPSNNLIYCIECNICHKMYVGQTKISLRSRMWEHSRNVTQNNTLIHSVGRHFNEPGHNGITYALQFARGHPDSSLLHR